MKLSSMAASEGVRKLLLHSLSSALIVGVGAFLHVGCSTQPSANVGHPAVFTSLHIQAATQNMRSEAASTGVQSNLNRYFASPEQTYTGNRLRMDAMLDEAQMTTARRQSQTLDVLLKAIAATGSGAVRGDPDPQPGGESAKTSTSNNQENTKSEKENEGQTPGTLRQAADKALSTVSGAAIVDSPFDRLDRVSDFYAAYLLKYLRQQGDSRVLDTDTLVRWYTNNLPNVIRTNPPSKHPSHRLLLLVLQTQVTAGNLENYMTGVRIRLTDACSNAVPVLRLHPSRTYDVDLTALHDESTLKWRIEGAGKPDPSLTLEGHMGGESKQETLKRFYARLGKVSSYINGPAGEFGWDFYPSNLRMVQANVVKSLYGLFFGTVERLRTKGFLEAGGRDTFAVVLVPWDTRTIYYATTSLAGKFSPDGAGLTTPQMVSRKWSERQLIELGEPSIWEAVASTVPVWVDAPSAGASPVENEQATKPAQNTGVQPQPAHKPVLPAKEPNDR